MPIRFAHFPDYSVNSTQGYPLTWGATAAYERVSENTIKVAFAHASLADHFCKKMGRTIAEGRLKKNVRTIELPAEPGKAVETIRLHLGA